MSRKTLVLFDFDGTISTSDTFPLFIKFFYGKRVYIKSLFILPFLFLYLLKLISADNAKEFILKCFFKGHSKDELFSRGKEFIEILQAQGKIKKEMIQLIKKYQNELAEIAVVSASADIWIMAFCEKYNLQCICTDLEFRENIFSGNFKTPNCNREEKKRRILEKYNLEDFDKIIAYGNSSGDEAMFSLANTVFRIK